MTLVLRLALLLSLLTHGVADADELVDRANLSREVRTKLIREQFPEVEALGKRLRTEKARTSSGLWKLTLFHSGVSSAYDDDRDNDEGWLLAGESTEKWVRTRPKSPIAHLAYARMLLARGWRIRGSGYANTVKPEDWPVFHAYVDQARLYLEKNKAVASVDPNWYETMIEIAALQDWPEPQFVALLGEALEREPAYYPTYFAAMRYYTPKWGGSAEKVEEFARAALAVSRSTEGHGLYARIYWYASQYQYRDRLFEDSLVDWDTMKLGIDDILAKYPDEWNIQNFVRFACMAEDKPKAAELLKRVKQAPLVPAWGHPTYYQQCRQWASN